MTSDRPQVLISLGDRRDWRVQFGRRYPVDQLSPREQFELRRPDRQLLVVPDMVLDLLPVVEPKWVGSYQRVDLDADFERQLKAMRQLLDRHAVEHGRQVDPDSVVLQFDLLEEEAPGYARLHMAGWAR